MMANGHFLLLGRTHMNAALDVAVKIAEKQGFDGVWALSRALEILSNKDTLLEIDRALIHADDAFRLATERHYEAIRAATDTRNAAIADLIGRLAEPRS